MPGMKVTLSAAMRARDVSRPQAEHEEAAQEAAERAAADGRSREDTGSRPMAIPKSVGGRPRRKRH